jgi:phage shock protein C
MPRRPRLMRSRERFWLGVCGGMAEFFGWSPQVVRSIFAIAGLLTGVLPALVIYAMLAWAMPKPVTFNLDDFREQ